MYRALYKRQTHPDLRGCEFRFADALGLHAFDFDSLNCNLMRNYKETLEQDARIQTANSVEQVDLEQVSVAQVFK